MFALFCLALILAVMSSGCSSVPKTEPPDLRQAEQDGLTVGIYPVATRSEVKRTFKINLLDRGVLPIRVRLENRNLATSFLIERDKIVVMNETTQMTNSSGQVARELATWSKGKQIATKMAFGASTQSPVLFLVIAMTPTPSEFVFKPDEEKLTSKEFVTRTVGPGQTAEGFVYFHSTEPLDAAKAYHLVADVKNLSTGETMPFDLKLNLNTETP